MAAAAAGCPASRLGRIRLIVSGNVHVLSSNVCSVGVKVARRGRGGRSRAFPTASSIPDVCCNVSGSHQAD